MRSPLETQSLIEWLERQPADRGYNYDDTHDCLFGQYLEASGVPHVGLSVHYWFDANYCVHLLPEGWPDVARDTPHTYGAALERARALS